MEHVVLFSFKKSASAASMQELLDGSAFQEWRDCLRPHWLPTFVCDICVVLVFVVCFSVRSLKDRIPGVVDISLGM